MKKILLCSVLFLILYVPLKATLVKDTLSAEWIGNWVDGSAKWKYGFFENFAVYDTDFWAYEAIHNRKRQTDITLMKGDRKVVVHIRKQKDGQVLMSAGKEKFEILHPAQKGFHPWPGKDSSFFNALPYRMDTVRLLGFYRNLEKIPERKVVTVYKNDFTLDKQLTFYGDIDSLGRFQLDIPVYSLEQLAVDWGFLNKRLYVVPGEKVLLCADAAELEKCNRAGTREEYWTSERNVLFMGENARFHTEFAYCPTPLNIRRYYDFKDVTDMQMLDALRGDLAAYRKSFRAYREKYPDLSRRCVELVDMTALYNLGFTLMQYRFGIGQTGRSAFDPGYMKYIETAFPLDCEWYYIAEHYFAAFCRDYYEYVEQQKDVCLAPGIYWSPSQVTTSLIFEEVRKEGWASSQELNSMKQYEELDREGDRLLKLKDTSGYAALWSENEALSKQIDELLQSGEVEDIRQTLNKRLKFHTIDSLFSNAYLRELMVVQDMLGEMERKRQPFGKRMLALIDERISNPDIKKKVLDEQEKYLKLMAKEITWLESLKNTEHLKDYKDSKELFEQLIAPYKGHVIYLDIWGTWCHPCREQMKYVGEVKKALKDEKVIFMYLANNSEEKTWKNVIREYDLSGEKVVHYRLPAEQQQLVERLLGITAFPTFMLIDQDGNIVNPNASRPEMKDQLLQQIREVLNSK